MFLLILIVFFLSLLSLLPGGAQGIALVVAGLLAPLLTQWFKGNWEGRFALAVAVGVSAMVAVGASYAAGEVRTWSELIKNATVVFGIAQLVYQAITLKPKPAI